ncbi:carbohydrate ABC transporter permease [Labrys wisconsinensis]|uniref:ABC-type glycerol-3-phosphate transport system permease component n=1 Tax=Labrys wisconsinensis TaxID=425677 RepID=A0ABU0J0A0_9HYPH|nr:carbohydrate ABC transporter permease [Labrys wisconsinensis]MDQ0467688.1 ABC-type glycerol-3-phosphate transport system permease component [Labrys wisconsinensis]
MSSSMSARPLAGLAQRGLGLLVAAVVLGPIAWGLATSLKTEVMAVALPPTIIPSPLTFENYLGVLAYQGFLLELWNSTLYAVGAVLVALLVGIPAGYAASRFDFPAKKLVMMVILATSMVPGVAVLVPTYYVLDAFGLLNDRFVIVVLLAARVAPQTVWFLQNFIDAVPIEIEESAALDGANRLQILTRLVLPLIKPGIAAIAVIGIVTIWNDYITVAVFAPDIGKRTLQVALVNQVFDAVGISWSYMMAFAIMASLPVMILFGLVQKWFVAGLTAGAVKG